MFIIIVGCTQKRKLPNGVDKPLPVSGDCYWLLEKWDKPLDGNDIPTIVLHMFIDMHVGTSFKFGDECSLRHLQTQKYLALNIEMGEFEV